MERLGHRATLLGRLRLLLKLGGVDAMNVADRREGDRRDTGSRHELDLGGGVETFNFVPGLAQAVREGHRVAGRVRRGEELLGTRAAVVPLRAARPRDRELVER